MLVLECYSHPIRRVPQEEYWLLWIRRSSYGAHQSQLEFIEDKPDGAMRETGDFNKLCAAAKSIACVRRETTCGCRPSLENLADVDCMSRDAIELLSKSKPPTNAMTPIC
jgi:hypothetical protein